MRASAFCAVGILAVACSQHSSDDLNVNVAPSILFPRGVLDNVQKLTVTVYDATGGLDCDPSKGLLSGLRTQSKVATKDLGTTCTAPAKFCGDLAITRSSTPRVFAAVGFGPNNTEVANGCAKTVVDQEKLPLTIQMFRKTVAAVCGDGTLQDTEQCEPPGDASNLVCDDQCHTKEERLSIGSGVAQNTTDGAPGEKLQPNFTWPPQSGTAGHFLAVWSDKKPRQQTAMRFMADDLSVDSAAGSAGTFSFWLPDTTSSFPPAGEPNSQAFPTATVVSGKYYVAFQDDTTGHPEIHLRTMNVADPTAGDQPSGSPIGISGPNGGGEAGVIHTLPSIAAGPGGAVYVAWQAGATTGPGKIVGRSYTGGSSPVYGPQVELSSGASNQGVQVAATSSGWVVVWQSGSDVKLRRIGTDGNPIGAEQTVNDGSHHGAQDHPGVATAGDAFAVAWADHGATGGTDIFVQRFKSDGSPIAGDQANRINNVANDGEQTTPAITGSTTAGGMYAVAWIDQASTHVRARLLGANGGFLFNNVDGQTGEFQASLTDGHARNNPALAIGGKGPYIAIGWEDLDATKPGIYVRRFPAPQ